MPLHVSSTCANHQEVKIALHNIWYHHTYRCDDTRGYVMPVHVSSTCAHHQEVKIALHNLWYHHTYRCDDRLCNAILTSWWWAHVLETYRCDDTRGYEMQFWPPDDEHMCSKHVEAWNNLIVKQKLFASSWLITEINIYFLYIFYMSGRYGGPEDDRLGRNMSPWHIYHFIQNKCCFIDLRIVFE